MDIQETFLRIAIIVAALIFAIWTGRANARRLRSAQEDVIAGRWRGYAIVVVVALAVVASLFLGAR